MSAAVVEFDQAPSLHPPRCPAPPQRLTRVYLRVTRCGPELVQAGLTAGCTKDDIRNVCSEPAPQKYIEEAEEASRPR